MMRNAFIFSTSYIPYVGGSEVAIRDITDRVRDINWSLITWVDDAGLPRIERIGNVTVYRIGGPKFLFPFTCVYKAWRLHKEKEPVFIWSNMATYAGFAGIIHKLLFPRIKFLLALQEGDPLFTMKRKAFFVYPLFMLMFRKADKIQAISHFLASYAKDMGHAGDVSVIPNGVDMNIFTAPIKESLVERLREHLGIRFDRKYIITTSRLVEKNGVDLLIKSLQLLPEKVHLLIVGIGEQEEYLRMLARECGVRDRVCFIGYVEQKDIPLFFAVSHVFVRPSRSEGLGNSFIEAMAFGLPVVATPVGGIPDFLDDMHTGLFCSPENPKSIASAVEKLLDDDVLRISVVQQAKERVLREYNADHVASRMKTEVFDQLT